MLPYPETIIKTETEDLRIERLQKSNVDDLVQLHTAVYHAPPKYDYHQKYNTAYTGAAYIGYIAYNKYGEPIAYYGALPCFVQYGQEIFLAAQSADTMTHPQQRFKGLFVTLSQMTFDLCRQENIKLLFGFPNQNSFHGAITKLGWTMTESMCCFTIPVPALPIAKLSKRWKLFSNIYQRYKKTVLQQIHDPSFTFSNPMLAENFAGVERSETFLNYKRYSQTDILEIGSAKVWISIKECILIGDIEGVSEANFMKVISGLKQLARRLGIRQLQFHTSPGTQLYSLFAASFTSIVSYPVLFQDFGSGIPLEKIKFTFADLDIF